MKNDLKLDLKLLASALRRSRELARVPFRKLSQDSGVSTSQILRIESGEFDCQVDSMIRLCGALGIRFGELLQRCVFADYGLYRGVLDKEIKEKYPANYPQTNGARLACKHLALGGAIALVHLLRSADAKKTFKELTFPDNELSTRFQRIADSIHARPPDLRTRITFFEELQTSPLSTLIRYYGFPTIEEIGAHLTLRPDLETAADDIIPTWMPTIERDALALGDDVEFHFLPHDKETDLTKTLIRFNIADVKPLWPALKRRLQSATAETGKKSELAKFLKMDLTRVSQWLTDGKSAREPGAEYALQMLQWVEQQERK